MTLFNMMKRSKSRSPQGRLKSGHHNSDSKPKAANARQNLDKYLGLARESMAIGDRIAAEGYYQHAEHYLRIINEVKAQQVVAEPASSSSFTEVATSDSEKGLSSPETIAAELACEPISSTDTTIVH